MRIFLSKKNVSIKTNCLLHLKNKIMPNKIICFIFLQKPAIFYKIRIYFLDKNNLIMNTTKNMPMETNKIRNKENMYIQNLEFSIHGK